MINAPWLWVFRRPAAREQIAVERSDQQHSDQERNHVRHRAESRLTEELKQHNIIIAYLDNEDTARTKTGIK